MKNIQVIIIITGQVETIQTTALLRLATTLRRIEETCCHSNTSDRPSANAIGKNSQRVTIITIKVIIYLFKPALYAMSYRQSKFKSSNVTKDYRKTTKYFCNLDRKHLKVLKNKVSLEFTEKITY